jgi:hypothetical protein
MSDISRISSQDLSESLNKRDLEVILEVNKKAIEIETGVADQNEEIISLLNQSKEKQQEIDGKLDKSIKQTEELSKDIFKLQVLFITGVLSLIVQIVQIFLKK